MEKILFRIESNEGDTQIEIPKAEVPQKINELVENGQWATTEKKDGTTETLTKKINPEDFKKTLDEVKSVTANSKMKGG
jgi:hypothetical protein